MLLNLPVEHFSKKCSVLEGNNIESSSLPSSFPFAVLHWGQQMVLFLTSWWGSLLFSFIFHVVFTFTWRWFSLYSRCISCRPCKWVFVGMNLSKHPLCSTCNHLTFYNWMSCYPQWCLSNPFVLSSFPSSVGCSSWAQFINKLLKPSEMGTVFIMSLKYSCNYAIIF